MRTDVYFVFDFYFSSSLLLLHFVVFSIWINGVNIVSDSNKSTRNSQRSNNKIYFLFNVYKVFFFRLGFFDCVYSVSWLLWMRQCSVYWKFDPVEKRLMWAKAIKSLKSFYFNRNKRSHFQAFNALHAMRT